MANGCGTKLTWIFALLLILVMAIQVRAQPPPGFINIDCGLKNFSAYPDANLNLRYSSDDEFVESGEKHEVLPEFMASTADDNQNTLRSFPVGSRNCYTLPSTPGKKYLLRAIFTYGNYDRLNKTQDGSLFRFGLHIGVNSWDSVDLSNFAADKAVWKEVLTVATGSSVSVCLVNLGSGTPFISSLELRPLLDTMYPFVNTSVSVSYFVRFRFGNITDYVTRYPTDNYDRFWESYSGKRAEVQHYPYISLNTSNNLENLPGNNDFRVPSAILQNAMSIDANNSSIIISESSGANKDAQTLQILSIFHFTELNGSNPNRRFNIYSAGEGLFPDFSPSRLKVDSMYKSGLFAQKGDAYFILNKTAGSSLPPLINALELYALVLMKNLTTDSDDVKYMKGVKAQYNLARTSWNGDPCSPVEYSWKGLTCDYSKSNQIPRIVTVNLSSSGLGGGLAISFMNMTSLQNLDLSHNNLTGSIPDYQLKSLKVLNLSNNKLDGPIPDSILQRVQAGQLDLREVNIQ
ncbi:hypothetical protein ACQJBY_053182 [Aegilops geniculata]